MSFRIHSVPVVAPCIIRVKHHQLPKELALAKLEAEIEYEDEYEDEVEAKVEHVSAPVPLAAHLPVQPVVPLPPIINAPAQPQPEPAQDETFKLRRKRRV